MKWHAEHLPTIASPGGLRSQWWILRDKESKAHGVVTRFPRKWNRRRTPERNFLAGVWSPAGEVIAGKKFRRSLAARKWVEKVVCLLPEGSTGHDDEK